MLKYMKAFTSLSEQDQQEIVEALVLEEFQKGDYLVKQGDVPTSKCYFVLKGCVRQFHVDESGKEVTSHFYTEEQAVLSFLEHGQESAYSLECLEDCMLIVGNFYQEEDLYCRYGQLETMTRKMMEIYLREVQEEYSSLVQSTPEERYKSILKNRSQLVSRVPQHQLASYLGMTPESLSRIKKRINHSDYLL